MASITWNSAVSGLFSTAADWNGGVVPGASDDAILGALGGAAYTVSAVNQTVNDLQTASNATLLVSASDTFQMTNGTGAGVNAGTIQVGNSAVLYLGGTVDNTNASAAGGIQLNAAGNSTELRLIGTSTTFTGGGTVVMGTGATNYIFGNSGSSNILINVNNTFSGVGQLGDGDMTMVNQAAGVVNANKTGALTLDVNGGLTNSGILKDTGTGGLLILNTTVDDTANSNGGRVQANGANAHVDLQSSYFIGGTFSTTGTGAVIDVAASEVAYFDGQRTGAPVNITAGSNILVNNSAILYLYGTINNAGTITLAASGNSTELRIVTPVVTLTGGGSVVLGTGATNYIFGNGGALNELDNFNNNISGVGQLGDGGMTLLNETAGVVNANQTGVLTLNADGGVTNTGLLEATNTGGLFILNTSVDNTQSSNAGKITASGAGAHVDLQNTNIYGGTLTTTGAGAVIDVVASQSVGFDGTYGGAPINITTGSTVQINNAAILYLRGVINNAGTIDLGINAEANSTEIRVNSPIVTLQGGGTIQMSNSANNLIFANDSANETLDNVNNTIQGSGNIGNGSMTLVNGALGIIDSNQQAGASGSGEPGQMIIDMNGGVTNSGLIEATVGSGNSAGGDLFILNTSVDDSSGGSIKSIGTGSAVDLQNSTIRGGTLSSSAGGLIDVVSGQSANLDGTNSAGLTLTGALAVNNNSTLYLYGSIVNKGTINLDASANSTEIRIATATVTLSGAGTVILTNSADNIFLSNSGNNSLINVNNTIRGAGNIGDGGALALVNQTAGIVNAASLGALTIQTSSTVENTGLLQSNTAVTGAGGLFILNTNIDNTGNGNAGKITATGTTGHVDLQNSNIYGGTLTATGSGNVIDVVSGQAAGLNGTVLGQAVNITAGSKFLVNNNSILYLYGAINNAGTITLGSTGNTTDIRLNSSLVTLTGGGNIVMTANTDNRIVENQSNAELDNVNNTISGAGQIGASGQMFLTNAGTIDATGTGGIAINLGGETVFNSGTIEATGSSLSVANGVFNSGNILANGANVTIAGDVIGTGTETITGAATLEIGQSIGGNADQAVSFSGGAGVFKIDTAQNFTGTLAGLQAGNTLDLGNVNFATASLVYSGNGSSGTLTVTDNTTTAVIKLIGNYTQTSFVLSNDGSGHTDVTYPGSGSSGPGNSPLVGITWKSAVSDLFSNAADWNGGVVPGSGNDAILGALGGAAYTVSAVNQVVGGLETASNATLLVSANDTFQINNGTDVGVNAGTIQIGNNAYLYLGGTVDNTNASAAGGIQVNASGNSTELRLIGTATTFTGGGTVVMGTGATNYIFGNSGASNTLVNVNNSFSGVGQLGNGSMTMVNQTAGVVNANQAGTLTLNVNGGVTNSGLLEDTGAGGLFILNTTVDNTANSNGGNVQANGANAHVDLQNSYFIGGTFSTTGSGAVIDVAANQIAYFDGQEPGAAINITAGSNILVNNNAYLYLYGTINNAGTITVAGNPNSTELRITSPVVTLTGGGNVVMGTGGTNYIFGNGGALNELDNVNNTISGVGQLGNGQMTLLNETAGVVNANQTGALTLNADGGVTNNGLLEATNTGGLLILNTGVDNTQASNAGKITASGAGAHVDLQNTTIYGGTLTTTGAGAVIDVVANQNAYFDGTYGGAPINIVSGSTVQVNNNAALYLRGIINNAGTIDLGVDAEANDTEIRLNSPIVTLQGGGTLQMSNSSNNLIFANDSANETLNNVNNTIQGSGDIGNGSMTLVNGALGIIDSNQQAGASGSGEPGQIVLQMNGGVTNSGLIEATVGTGNTAGGDLFILNTTVDDSSGGSIQSIGTGSAVDLQNATIRGGTLSSSAGGLLDVAANQNAFLDGTNSTGLTLSGALTVNNNAALYLYGSIVNQGTINVDAAGNDTEIRITTATVTLSGGGSVTMNASASNLIFSNAGNNSLVNVNNTIQGAGNIGNGGALTLVNQTAGIINGNSSVALTIETGSTVENTGLIESNTSVVGAGGLFILNTNIDNTGNGNAGQIVASGATGHVDLQNSNIYGGTLTATGAGNVIDVVTGQVAGLNGTVLGQAVNITAGSNVLVNNNAILYLYGKINNAGTITVDATSNTTDIRLNSSLITLTGGGDIVLTNNTSNRIVENQGNSELDNVDNTISGAGQIGAGGLMTLVNGGTIDANQSGALTIDTGGATDINFATGVLEGSGAGGLILQDSTYLNNGLVAALDGSTVTYESTAGNVNNSFGTLTGGTWEASASGDGATLSITGGAVVTDAATIILSGAGSVFQAGDGTTFTTIETSLTTIANKGTLEVLGNRNYSTSNAITVSGTLTLGGGTFTAGSLTIASGGSITGYGTVTNALTNPASIKASGGTLDFTGKVTDSNPVSAASGATVEFDATGNSFTSAFSGAGTLAFGGSGTDAINSGATIKTAGWTLTGTAAVTLNEIVTYTGTFTQGAGTKVIVASGYTLYLEGTSTLAGSISGAGGVNFSGGTATLNSGFSVTATSVTIGNGATVTVAENLTVGNQFTQNAGTSLSISSGDTLTLKGTSSLSGAISGAGTLALTGGGTTFRTGATLTVSSLTVSGSSTVLYASENLTYGGTFSSASDATVQVTTGETLTFTGAATLGGFTAGSGTFVMGGSGTDAINSGAGISVSNWMVSGSAAVTVNKALVYAGAFTDAAGTVISITSGDSLTLTGTSSLSGEIDGPGGLTTKGPTSVAGLILGHSTTWLNSGKTTETGSVTVGDSAGATATLNNASTGTYDITADVGIGLGTGGSGTFTNNGVLEKTAGTGTSAIALAVTNNKTITISSGTLELENYLNGTGTTTISGASTLELDSAAYSPQVIAFSGSGGDLETNDATQLKASISGFGSSDTIDLANFALSGTQIVSFVENGSNTQGVLTVKDGSSTASITLLGQYVLAGFQKGPDSGAGTAITYTPPPGPAMELAAVHH